MPLEEGQLLSNVSATLTSHTSRDPPLRAPQIRLERPRRSSATDNVLCTVQLSDNVQYTISNLEISEYYTQSCHEAILIDHPPVA